MKTIPNRSGIYKIIHIASGKCYVGSAANLRKRLNNHRFFLSKGTHHSRHLQSAWNKYGGDAFSFSPIMICSLDMLLFYEQRAFDTLRPPYNVNPLAASPLGVKWKAESRARKSKAMKGNRNHLGFKHSPETREKMAAMKRGRALTQEHRAKIGAASLGNKHALGKRHDDRWKEFMSKVMKGRKFSPETISKMSAAAKLRWEVRRNRLAILTDSQRLLPVGVARASPTRS